ncbi:hypothetical protein [Kyrpidia spormannii]|uniref:Uncharacterized protein n=2 Tax=Kyrpidia spormannii TaxID=2055160 RepID=A0ACA8Z8K4_9BACL|nr:hypothetical protein [Kyrpidia spormannii]CAB3392218.1 conserved protein of unknown function [Kyrpidia spormannii]
MVRHIVSEIDQSSLYIIRDNQPINCPAQTYPTTSYSIVIHDDRAGDRSFMLTLAGCTLLHDEKDDLVMLHDVPAVVNLLGGPQAWVDWEQTVQNAEWKLTVSPDQRPGKYGRYDLQIQYTGHEAIHGVTVTFDNSLTVSSGAGANSPVVLKLPDLVFPLETRSVPVNVTWVKGQTTESAAFTLHPKNG